MRTPQSAHKRPIVIKSQNLWRGALPPRGSSTALKQLSNPGISKPHHLMKPPESNSRTLSNFKRDSPATEHLKKLLNSPSIEALWDMHTRQMAEYGFDRLIYGYTRYRTATSLGDPDDFVLLTNHEPEFTEVFIGDGLYHHGPMVRWALDHDGACSWSVMQDMVQSGTLSDQEKKVVEFNQRQGVLAGYSISFKSVSPRSKGAIALTARAGLSQADVDKIWAEHGDDMRGSRWPNATLRLWMLNSDNFCAANPISNIALIS